MDFTTTPVVEPLFVDTQMEYKIDWTLFPGFEDPVQRAVSALRIHTNTCDCVDRRPITDTELMMELINACQFDCDGSDTDSSVADDLIEAYLCPSSDQTPSPASLPSPDFSGASCCSYLTDDVTTLPDLVSPLRSSPYRTVADSNLPSDMDLGFPKMLSPLPISPACEPILRCDLMEHELTSPLPPSPCKTRPPTRRQLFLSDVEYLNSIMCDHVCDDDNGCCNPNCNLDLFQLEHSRCSRVLSL